MIVDILKERIEQEPFQPFTVITSAGKSYEVRNPALAVLLKSSVWIAIPNSDRMVQVPYLHVAAVESGDGNGRKPGRGKHGR
jgi:hypothetical protein